MRKEVLVIGASRGIGKELLMQFSEKGCSTHGFARSFNHSYTEGLCHYHHLDLESETLKDDLARVLVNLPKIDCVIYNAGAIVVKPFLELSRAEISRCYQVNVIAAMEVLQVCIPKMAEDGHIVLISSIGGFQGSLKFPGLSAYSTSKAALTSLTELLSEEFKNTGIAINCLCLGAVQTEMMEEAFPGYQAPHTPNQIAAFITDFTLNMHPFFKGKIIPVSVSNP